MSVSLVESCLMTSHRDLFPVLSSSLNKLSITPSERFNHVSMQEDMLTDKDEVSAKPQAAEVSNGFL